MSFCSMTFFSILYFLLLPDEVSCEAVVPLKRQVGFLSLTQQLLQALKEKLEPHLTAIMPTLLTTASHCAQLLSTQRDKVGKTQGLVRIIHSLLLQIAVGFVSSLKNIRQLVINLLQEVMSL